MGSRPKTKTWVSLLTRVLIQPRDRTVQPQCHTLARIWEKKLRVRTLMDSSWQVSIANLTKFGALFFSPHSVSGSASSRGISRNLLYSCTCSIYVQLHAGTSLDCEALSWWHRGCLNLTWLITVMLTASQLVAVTASAQVPCQVSAKHSAVLGILAVRGMQYLPKNIAVHKSR